MGHLPMKKDIFVDNNAAKCFANPMDDEYKQFILWLARFNSHDPDNNAHLVVCTQLIGEYMRTSSHCTSQTNIAALLDKLTRQNRLMVIGNTDIRRFKLQYFRKSIIKTMSCNSADRNYIAVVLLSDRKMALTLDNKFRNDLISFPGFKVIAERRPELIPYK